MVRNGPPSCEFAAKDDQPKLKFDPSRLHFAVTKLKEAAKKARIRNFDPANFGIV
jgi:hypothetical protein